jgi:hypothetical protein
MLDLFIEDRYSKRSRPIFHSSAFAIGAAVVGVAAAGAGAAVSIDAANRAARAQGGASRQAQKREQEALERFRSAMSQVQAPKWNLARDIKEAGQITDYSMEQLEKIFPGATNQRQIAAQATESYLRGEIPQDVQDQVMRSVAELGGAGFQPTAGMAPQGQMPGGFQTAQGLLSRQLGLTSLDLQMQGQGLAQNWQSIAGSFIESPLQVGQARLGYEEAAADIQMRKAAAEAGIALDISGRTYGRAVDTIGSRLAANQAVASGIQSVGGAISGGLAGYGQAKQMQQFAQGGLGAIPAASGAGGYATPGAARQAAPFGGSISNVQGMGYVPRAQIAPSAIRATTGGYG